MKTGDLGFLDATGYLHLTGPRQGPDHPRRRQHLAAGDRRRPDAAVRGDRGLHRRRAGQDVRRGGGRLRRAAARCAIGADDILRHCAAALPAFKTPKQIVLSDELPKTERGKLDRKALVERWTAGDADMKLKDEPNNWLGLVLILVLILVFALVIRWAGLLKSPSEYRLASAHPRPPLAALSQRLDNLETTSRESSHARLCAHAPLRRRDNRNGDAHAARGPAAEAQAYPTGPVKSSCRSAPAAPPTFCPACSPTSCSSASASPSRRRTAAAPPARSPRRRWPVRRPTVRP
jgi:hypothetical protein